ncbi:MAG: NTP transferase domain-containing protein, partial [Alphaproteobacteria bacterium]|nr:NTP transferase domain-containing protein [Alphaproteobacteria bacterium]
MPVVLAGGSGYRLWPLSRAEQPKQFAQLMGEYTPFQEAVRRASAPERFAPPLIVAGEAHRFIVQDQLEAIAAPSSTVILEPEGKNTAPAAALAAFLLVEQKQAEALMLLMPSDHYIAHGDAFFQAVMAAAPAAKSGRIVTFGVTPDAPETGYGYIRRGMA